MATTLERVQEIIMALDDKYKANWLLEELEAELISQGAEPKEAEGNVTADADVEAYQNRQKSIALGEPLLEQGYWSCPKCGDGYKHKGAARKCCQRGKECLKLTTERIA